MATLSLFFSVVTTLDFAIEFLIGNDSKDLLFFEGKKGSIHLFYADDFVHLSVTHLTNNGSVYARWIAPAAHGRLKFEWPDLRVNDKMMNLTTGTHDVRFSDFNLSNYVFVDPYIEPTTVLEELTYGRDNFSRRDMKIVMISILTLAAYLALSSCFGTEKSREILRSIKSILISRRLISIDSLELEDLEQNS